MVPVLSNPVLSGRIWVLPLLVLALWSLGTLSSAESLSWVEWWDQNDDIASLSRMLVDGSPEVRDASLAALRKRTDGVVPAVVAAADGISRSAVDPQVIATLSEALQDPGSGQRQAAVWALRAAASIGSVPALIEALQGADRNVARVAAMALGDIGDQRAVAPLMAQLQDSSTDMRVASIWALGEIGAPAAVAALFNALGDSHREVRAEASDALEKLQEPSGRIVYKTLRGSKRALAQLGPDSDPRSVEPLLRALDNPDPLVRGWAAKGLEKLASAAAVSTLLEHLDDPVAEVRAAVAWALVAAGDPRAETPFVNMLNDPFGEAREAAAAGLVKVAGPDAVEALIDSVTDPVTEVRGYALDALGRLADRRALPAITVALQDPRGQVRASAARALGPVGGEEVLAILVEAMNDAYFGVRAGAVESLGAIGGPKVISVLREALDDPASVVRARSIRALAKVQGKDAAEMLMPMLVDPHRTVRRTALAVLESLGIGLRPLFEDPSASSEATLAAVVREQQPYASQVLLMALRHPDPLVRQAVARITTGIGGSSVTGALVTMAGGWNPVGRVEATRALLRLPGQGAGDILVTTARVLIQPASLVYLAGVVLLGWLLRRRFKTPRKHSTARLRRA